MSAATAVEPVKVEAPPLITNHIYHRVCNPPESVHRVAYCGHKANSKTAFVPWNPLDASAEDCSMCLENRATIGCPKCGVKP